MPSTLGVGYANIAGQIGVGGMLARGLLKLLSWSVALGSATSGGALAPLVTIGAMDRLIGFAQAAWMPWLQVDPRMRSLPALRAPC